MKSRLIIHLLFVISSLFTYEFYSPAYGQSSCADWGSPLERKLINDDVNSPFNPDNDHYGTDYKAVDGDSVLAVADGEIDKIGSDFRQEINRLGLMGKGWGTYVVVKHKDGSTTLYAHLLKDSTNHLGVGMPVAKGTKIGEADSTGGASGPHLHIEYAPNGRWRDKSSLTNPHPCIIGCPETLSTITLAGPDAPSDGSQYTATGGTEPYTWSISKGSITQGGVVTISGQCGTATITATDSCVNQGTKDVRMPSGTWVETSRIQWIFNCYCGGGHWWCGTATYPTSTTKEETSWDLCSVPLRIIGSNEICGASSPSPNPCTPDIWYVNKEWTIYFEWRCQ